MTIGTLETVVSIFLGLAGIYFAYKQLMIRVDERLQRRDSDFRVAELEDQKEFRSQLMQQINEQSARITNQDVHIANLTIENQDNKKHREICERDLKKSNDNFTKSQARIKKLEEAIKKAGLQI